jgi:sec-independent protein translocase protein TatA
MGWEWAIILVIVIIIFGVGKLPQIGGAMGKAIRQFRKARSSDEAEEGEGEKEKPKAATAKEDTKPQS